MNNNTGFLLGQLWGLDCCGWFFWMGLKGLQLPILYSRCNYEFSLKCPLTRNEYNRRNTESNPLYPSSYKPPNLSHTCYTTRCRKNYLERPWSVKTINKKKKENWTGKGNKWKGISNVKLYTVIFSYNIREGKGDAHPLLIILPYVKILEYCVAC